MLKNWTNKELDGTLFLVGIFAVFIMNTYFTYKSPEFANLSTTGQAFEILKGMLYFMAGFYFKTGVANMQNGNGSDTQNTEPDQKEKPN